MHGEVGGPAAEIDLCSEQPNLLRGIAFGALPPDLATDQDRVTDWRADARQHNRADRVAARGEARAENRPVTEVDELSRFAVAPVEDANAGADERLDRALRPIGRNRAVAVIGTMRSFRS